MSDKLVKVSEKLRDAVASLHFSAPVAFVYNPLEYAWESHREYVRRYGADHKEVLLIGMNPGPFGMAQTGVPFGNVSTVRDWLKIEKPIGKPEKEHPKRPVLGLKCPREEVSGSRLWGWAADRYQTPDKFFKRFFVINYCPLLFLEKSAKNFTPDHLPAGTQHKLLEYCDEALRTATEILKPKLVVGVGGWAFKRVQVALQGMDVETGTILHPSPASPVANRGWSKQAEKQLVDLGVKL